MEAVANSWRKVGEPREEPHGLNPASRSYEFDFREFENHQDARLVGHLYFPFSAPSLAHQQAYQRFIELVTATGPVQGYVVVCGVSVEQFMVPITDLNHQIRAISSLSRRMFGAYTSYIVYPKRRSSIKYEWTKRFSDIFTALDVRSEDGIPIITLCASSYAQDGVLHASRSAAVLTAAEEQSFENTFKYWCNEYFATPPTRGQMFRHVYYMICCAFKARGGKRISLHTDYGAEDVFGDIMDLIRNYCPLPKGASRDISLPCKTTTVLEFGANSKAFVYGGYGSGQVELQDNVAAAPSDMVECLNMNGAGTGNMLTVLRTMVEAVNKK